MRDASFVSFAIALAGVAWAVACEFGYHFTARGRQFSPPISFWIRTAGWIGLAAFILASLLSFIAVLIYGT